MASIGDLSVIEEISDDDKFPIFDERNQRTRSVSAIEYKRFFFSSIYGDMDSKIGQAELYSKQSKLFSEQSNDYLEQSKVVVSEAKSEVISSASQQVSLAQAQADRAKQEADRAKQITGLNTVADAIGMAAVPYPDVWIPLGDSLRMLAGYGREVKVGDDVVASYATLTRNSAATMVSKSGQLVSAAINEARFERKGLLVEPLMTNLCQQSAFKGTSPTNTNEKWVTSSCSVLPSSAIGVDGVSNAVEIKTIVAGHFKNSFLRTGYAKNSECVFTASVWVKPLASSKISILLAADIGGAIGARAAFDLNANTVSHASVGGGSYVSGSIINGEIPGWALVSLTASVPSATNVTAFIYPGRYDNQVLGESVIVDDFQLELSGFLTSHIPTDGSATTRAADKLTIPRLNNDCTEWYSGPDQINPIVTADTIELQPPTGKAHLRNVKGFFTPLTPEQKKALK